MPGRLRRHDDYGHIHFLTISCFRRLPFFRHNTVKQVFVDGMSHTRQRLGIRWVGYVIMPEHVHLLCFPSIRSAEAVVPISTVLQHLKQYVGRHGKSALRTVWARHRTLGMASLDRWANGEGSKPFWKTRAYDFNITAEDTFHKKLDYIHKNPVTRGLVDRAEQWRWRSYRYYEIDDRSPIAMDWDGSWPIV